MGRKRKPTPTCIDIVRPSKRNPGLSTGQMLSQARSRAAQNAAGVPTNDVYSDLSPGLSEASTTAELSDEEDYECEAGTSGLPGISPHPEPVYPVREYFPEEDDPEEREFPEEHALRPLPRRGHPPIPPHPQPQRMPGRNDKRLFYSMSSLHSGTSKAEMLRNESLHKVLNDGRHQDIRLEEHLEPFYKEILHEYDLQHFFFCPGCSRAIGSRKERCRNRLCQYFNLKCKRSGPRRRVELVLANVKPQLREILSDHFDEIRSVHEYIHHAKANGTLTARSDVRFFPRYSDRIESQLEFQNRQLQVNLCLSSDGYRPNRLSKHEFWPLYLRVDGINAQDRDAYRNSTVSAVLFTRKSHTLSLSHHFVSRLIEELEDLRVTPMTMPDSAGNLWTIRFSVESGVMDFAGLRDFYKLPRWNAEMGCGKCEIPGRRVGRTRSWANDNVRYGRRNRASILRDGARGVNGVTAITPAMELITPDRFPADSLHVVSEGVAMDRFKDLFDKGRIEELNLSAVDIGALKESVSRVVNHTYCGAYVLSVEDRSSITGSEKQQMCNLLFPLAAGCSPSLQKRVSCVASGMLIGFWWVCRTLEWHQTLTQDKINLVKVVGADVQFLQEQLNPESISMKCHSFLEHSIRDELEEAGSCFAWTAGFSESWHREFQLKHNQSATNCQMDSVKRYLLRKAVYRRFRDCTLVNRHPDYIQLLAETENSHINRFPIKFRVDNIMYVPEKSAIKVNLVTNPNHTPFVRNAFPGSELSSRLMVDGEVYASEIFWSRAKDSQQNLCYVEYRRNNRLVRTFGSVIMFLSDRNGRSELLLRQFETACPFTDLLNRINHYRQPNWLVAHRMLQIVSRNNTFFRKVLREQIMSKPAPSSPDYDPQLNHVNPQLMSAQQKMDTNPFSSLFPLGMMMGSPATSNNTMPAHPTMMNCQAGMMPHLFGGMQGFNPLISDNSALAIQQWSQLVAQAAAANAPTPCSSSTPTPEPTEPATATTVAVPTSAAESAVQDTDTDINIDVTSVNTAPNTVPVSYFRREIAECHNGERFIAEELHKVLEDWQVNKNVGESRMKSVVHGLRKEGYKPYFDFSGLEQTCRDVEKRTPEFAPMVKVVHAMISIQKFTNLFYVDQILGVQEQIRNCSKSVDEMLDKPTNNITVCLSNIKTAFMVPPELPPFKSAYIRDLLNGFLIPKKKQTDKQMQAAYIHVLHRITDPPPAVKSFTIRDRSYTTKGNEGEEDDKKLVQLPEMVKNVLIGCGLEMVGFADQEIYASKYHVEDLVTSNTEYWRQLGDNDEARTEKLLYNRSLVEKWRDILKGSLKEAVKAVRYHQVKQTNSGWEWESRKGQPFNTTSTVTQSRKRPHSAM